MQFALIVSAFLCAFSEAFAFTGQPKLPRSYSASMPSSHRSSPCVLNCYMGETATIKKTNIKIDHKVQDEYQSPLNWEVRIYNDEINTMEYVCRSLVEVTGVSDLQAYRTMKQCDSTGTGIVGTYCLELAEAYSQGLLDREIQSEMIPLDE